MAKKRFIDPEGLITQAEAAELRGVTLASINELIQRERLNVVEMFGRKLLNRAEVEGFTKLKTGPKTGRRPARKRTVRKKVKKG